MSASRSSAFRFARFLLAMSTPPAASTNGSAVPSATFAAALQVCKEAPKGSTILCMLPDTGERYLSTALFADIPTDMTDEERAIAESI